MHSLRPKTISLNSVADQGGENLSKMLDEINRSLSGLQRDLSQVIYRLGSGR
jgi:hypothetical protein